LNFERTLSSHQVTKGKRKNEKGASSQLVGNLWKKNQGQSDLQIVKLDQAPLNFERILLKLQRAIKCKEREKEGKSRVGLILGQKFQQTGKKIGQPTWKNSHIAMWASLPFGKMDMANT
jgi:hypothetical protein